MTPKLFECFHRSGARSGHAGRAPAAGAYRRLGGLAAALFILGGLAHATPAVAESAALYEQDQSEPQGKRYAGSVTWRTETWRTETWRTEKEPAGAARAPELAVRADIAIPERRMTASWVLRRNTDRSLPATHTIDVMFTLPADFPGRGIAQVPGVTLKPTEQVRGTPLAGLVVKVTDNFFLIGLSALEGDVKFNADILRDGRWLDILIIYASGNRAVLTMEKGASGDRAFADAFAAWGK